MPQTAAKPRKPTELKTTTAVIDALGGTRAVADLLGFSYTRVYNWRTDEAFPANVHAVLTDALRQVGLRAPKALFGQIDSPPTAPLS